MLGVKFSWPEYLDVANCLAGNSCQTTYEARSRASISRAYYAAFCKARNYLRDVENDRRLQGNFPGNVHVYVIDSLANQRDRKLVKASTILQNLRNNRNKADYDDLLAGLHAKVRNALRDSQMIISIIDSL